MWNCLRVIPAHHPVIGWRLHLRVLNPPPHTCNLLFLASLLEWAPEARASLRQRVEDACGWNGFSIQRNGECLGGVTDSFCYKHLNIKYSFPLPLIWSTSQTKWSFSRRNFKWQAASIISLDQQDRFYPNSTLTYLNQNKTFLDDPPALNSFNTCNSSHTVEHTQLYTVIINDIFPKLWEFVNSLREEPMSYGYISPQYPRHCLWALNKYLSVGQLMNRLGREAI